MPDIRLQDYTTKIRRMIREVRLDEAIAHCQHILRHYPKHIETYCLLGEACLEREMYREAIEFFQRALSGDPESLIARVGLGIIYDEQGALPEAIWQLERAFELAPGNAEVRRELQRLYARRDGSEKGRLKLTRGSLGRLYGRNGLYERAIGEFQAVLYQDPDLPDIQVALAESLWREDRRLEAVETCQDLLEKLPNCLKANLILGAIWVPSENVEAGEECLAVARALDPENLLAQEMMGQDSPLPPEEVLIPELEAVPEGLEIVEPARWDEEAEAVGIEAGQVAVAAAAGALAAEEELPDWLRDVGVVAEEEPAADLEAEEAMIAEGEPEEVAPSEMPDWLQEAVAEEAVSAADEGVEAEVTPSEEVLEREIESEVPEEEHLAEPAVMEEVALEAEEKEDWLITAGIVDEEEEEPVPAGAADEDIPEWLRELIGGEAPSPEEVPVEPAEELEPPVAEVAAEEIVADDEVAEPVSLLEEVPEEGWEAEVPEEEPVPAATVEVEEAPEVEVPASLTALVDAGLLDEADLESAMADLSEEELASQRAEDVPIWLQELIGEAAEPASEEAAVKEPIPAAQEPPSGEGDLLPAEETPAWLRDLTEPADEEEISPVAEPPEEEPPAAEEVTLPVIGEPEEEPAIVEEVVLPVVGEPEEEPPVVEEVTLPVVGEPEEEPSVAEEAALPVVEEREEEAPVVEEVSLPAAELEAEPVQPPEGVPVPVAEAPTEEEGALPSRVNELVEQLKTRPRDANLRLELARLYVAEQDWDAALAQYGKLVSTRKQLPDVIQDLEPLEQTEVDRAQLYQLLGDAYMHQDQLDKALQMYRQARQSLTRR
jgi:tetratricopeptide (TPR) repeat protein